MIRTLLISLGSLLLLGACSPAATPDSSIVPTSTVTTTSTTSPTGSSQGSDPESFAGTTAAFEFPPGLDWLNTATPITLEQLRGKVVLLDFWTYGCINCIHVIPDLKRLEEEFAEELVVIGVHSAKFLHEGETDNIRNVILRYEVEHPVVNDRDFTVWRTWGARAWPTTTLIDPAGNIVGGHSGEGVYDVVQPIIASLIAEFDPEGGIDRTPLEFDLEKAGQLDTVLSYPGKVLSSHDSDELFVADSGNHRVLRLDARSGEVLAIYGLGTAGYSEGDALEAEFDSPQGMALSPDGHVLYVADTNNHAVRRIDLNTGTVDTVVGTGRLGWPPVGGPASEVAINSPWALELRDNRLYIAMAGHHQIWVYDLDNEFAAPLVGNAREGTLNTTIADAELAQPSGLAFDRAGILYFADSESSAVRSADILNDSGQTAIIAGSELNLFDFGDVDGIATAARLQHPLGLAFADDGYLYVADTYNSKIKRIDLANNEITTVAGSTQGWADGSSPQFYEPGGLSAAGNTLWVADTNNHVIRSIDLTTYTASTLVVKGVERFLPPPNTDNYQGTVVELDVARIAAGEGTVTLDLALPPDHKLNETAPSSVQFMTAGTDITFEAGQNVDLTGATLPVVIGADFSEGSGQLTADVTAIYCREGVESLCLIQQLLFVIPIEVTDRDGATDLTLEYSIELPSLDG